MEKEVAVPNLSSPLFHSFATKFHCVALAGGNSQRVSCLCLLNAEIKGVGQHTCLVLSLVVFLNKTAQNVGPGMGHRVRCEHPVCSQAELEVKGGLPKLFPRHPGVHVSLSPQQQ